jgi:mannose-6-phosphate isomerase-like protein (cupin superfamily)
MTVEQQAAIPFSFSKPDSINGKARVGLGSGGMVTASVQYLEEGGDNNLHAHSAEDEVFLILGGRVRFYGVGDALIAELGANEGLVVPRGVAYWFERVGDETLAIYKVGAQDPRMKNERINYGGVTDQQKARGDEHPLTGRDASVEESKAVR